MVGAVAPYVFPTAPIALAPTCPNGNNGVIVINATGGNQPLEYGVVGVTLQNNNVITGLAPGSYDVFVTDQHNCAGGGYPGNPVIVPNAPAFAVTSVNIKPISCSGANDAIVTVNTTRGTPPLLFTLTSNTTGASVGPQNTNVFTQVGSGTFTVTVTDNNTPPCVASFTTPPIVNPSVVSVNTFTTPPLCAGQATGKIFVFATGGTPPYTYSIDGGKHFGSKFEFDNIAAGQYNVIAKDSHGCFAATIATVSSPSAVNFVSITKTDVTCNSLSNGAIRFLWQRVGQGSFYLFGKWFTIHLVGCI